MLELAVRAFGTIRAYGDVVALCGRTNQPFQPPHRATGTRSADHTEAESAQDPSYVLAVPVFTDQHDGTLSTVYVDQRQESAMPKDENYRLTRVSERQQVFFAHCLKTDGREQRIN